MSEREATKSLNNALSRFKQHCTDDQRQQLQTTTRPAAQTVLHLAADLDARRATDGLSGQSCRIMSFLESIQEFTTVVDTFVSSNPAVAALVWGSVKIAMMAAMRITSYFDKLSHTLMSIGKMCPRLSAYQRIFPESKELCVEILQFYTLVIEIARLAVEAIQRPGTVPQAETSPGLITSVCRPFEKEFEPCMQKLREKSDHVREVIALASEEAQHASRSRVTDILRFAKQREQQDKFFGRVRLLECLPACDTRRSFTRAQRAYVAGTCEWLLQDPEFMTWMSNRPSLLWCFGRLGCGKTVLSTYVIHQLLIDPRSRGDMTIYFFCDPDWDASLVCQVLIGTLIRQLQQPENMTVGFEQELERQRFQLDFSQGLGSELSLHLFSLAIARRNVNCVIDGIDECEPTERAKILQFLATMEVKERTLRIFCTARDNTRQEVRRYCRGSLATSITQEDLRTACEKYLDATFSGLMKEERLKFGNAQLEVLAKETIRAGANGMFLWIYLQLETLCRQQTDEEIIEALDNLPSDLIETYRRLISKIPEAARGRMDLELSWVTYAMRPLTREELREAITIDASQTSRQTEKFVNNLSSLVDDAAGLLVADEEHDTVHFTHHTVRAFLKSEAGIHFKTGSATVKQDLALGICCVTYLNYTDFQRQISVKRQPMPLHSTKFVESVLSYEPARKVYSRLVRSTQSQNGSSIDLQGITAKLQASSSVTASQTRTFPFLEYANKFWPWHTKGISLDSGRPWILWKKCLNSVDIASLHGIWLHQDYISRAPAFLEWAVRNQHMALLTVLFEQGVDCETLDQIMEQCISLDAATVALTMIQAYGTRFKHKTNIAIWSAGKGHIHIIELLVHAGCDESLNVTYLYRRTALQAASGAGHIKVVERLLQAKADVNAAPASTSGRTALQAASEAGHVDIVERLLRAGADVNAAAARYSGLTALQAASEGGHMDIVERLLRAGADVNAEPAWPSRPTPLQAASGAGHVEIVERLLRAEADVNAAPVTSSGRTALQAASEGGHMDIVERLLRAGADVNAAPAEYAGRTALQAASEGGHMDIVERLLRAGADVNAAPAEYAGRTALQAASQRGHMEVVKRLLRAGADVNAAPAQYSGRMALQAASEGGHMEVVERLLRAGADVNAVLAEWAGLTALQAALKNGHMEIVELLRQAQASRR